MSPVDVAHDAIVLAGGASRRMGVDKLGLPIAGVPLLERVLAAVPTARRVVVVGPPRPLARPVAWARERPPGGGPVAGIAAGLPSVRADVVVALAGDLPFVTAGVVAELVHRVVESGADGAVLLDADAVRQPLCGAWRTSALRAAVARLPSPAGTSVRRLIADLAVAEVEPAGDGPPAWWDCDSDDDLQRARRLL